MRVSSRAHGSAMLMSDLCGTGEYGDAIEYDSQAQQDGHLQTPATYPLMNMHNSVLIHNAGRWQDD